MYEKKNTLPLGLEENGWQADGPDEGGLSGRLAVSRPTAGCTSRAPHPDQPPAVNPAIRAQAVQMSFLDQVLPAWASSIEVTSR